MEPVKITKFLHSISSFFKKNMAITQKVNGDFKFQSPAGFLNPIKKILLKIAILAWHLLLLLKLVI